MLKYLVQGLGVRKNLSVIESYTRIQFKVMSKSIYNGQYITDELEERRVFLGERKNILKIMMSDWEVCSTKFKS